MKNKKVLPESWTPKVFEYCLMGFECDKYDRYELCQFAFKDEFYHAVGGSRYPVCIPYKGNEKLLGKHMIE